MNLVTLRDVGVAYDGYEALQHVDLEIAKNDFLGVIGPNGGGKTTLVKAILGTVPHTGEVRLAPELFRDKERLIGYMPQLSDFDRTHSACWKRRAWPIRPATLSAKFRAARCSGRCCAEPSFPIPSC